MRGYFLDFKLLRALAAFSFAKENNWLVVGRFKLKLPTSRLPKLTLGRVSTTHFLNTKYVGIFNNKHSYESHFRRHKGRSLTFNFIKIKHHFFKLRLDILTIPLYLFLVGLGHRGVVSYFTSSNKYFTTDFCRLLLITNPTLRTNKWFKPRLPRLRFRRVFRGIKFRSFYSFFFKVFFLRGAVRLGIIRRGLGHTPPRRVRPFRNVKFLKIKLPTKTTRGGAKTSPIFMFCGAKYLYGLIHSSLNIFKPTPLTNYTPRIDGVVVLPAITHHIRRTQVLKIGPSWDYIFSKNNSQLIFSNMGIILPFKFFYKFRNIKLYIIRKKFYSFLRLNEYKLFILTTKKKLMLSKFILFRDIRGLLRGGLNLTRARVMHRFFAGGSDSDSYLSFFSELIYKKNNFLWDNTARQIHKDVRIQRVRFRPGYQRQWRNFRLALSDSIDFSFVYQKQLTKYLIRFSRRIGPSFYTHNENMAWKLLIYSHLIPDASSVNLLFTNNLIFLNNKVLLNRDIFVYGGDLLQLEISSWYYIFSRWLLNTTKLRNNKFRKLIYRKNLPLKYTQTKQKKQRSNYTPKWIKIVKFDFSDIKPFLEVDFFTLSVFYIYDYNFFSYYTPNDALITRYNIFRMYNWKYLT